MRTRGFIGLLLRWLGVMGTLVALAGGWGCARTPASAIALSAQVREGVTRMQADTERLASSLADTQRAALDEAWEADYARVEAMYLEETSADVGALSMEQRAEVAALASAVRERTLAAITDKERELIDATRANTHSVLVLHDALTAHLLSLRSAQRFRENALMRLDALTGWDIAPALVDLEQAIAQFEDDAQGRD
jgi:hypothetical protein